MDYTTRSCHLEMKINKKNKQKGIFPMTKSFIFKYILHKRVFYDKILLYLINIYRYTLIIKPPSKIPCDITLLSSIWKNSTM